MFSRLFPKSFFQIVFPKNLATAEFFNKADKTLSQVFMAFKNAGKIERAFAVIKKISGEDARNFLFAESAEHLTKAGNIDKALHLAGMISEGHTKERAFRHIFTALVKAGNLDEALCFAKKSSNAREKDLALRSISNALTIADKFDEALRIAKLIADEQTKKAALSEIDLSQTYKRHPERAAFSMLNGENFPQFSIFTQEL